LSPARFFEMLCKTWERQELKSLASWNSFLAWSVCSGGCRTWGGEGENMCEVCIGSVCSCVCVCACTHFHLFEPEAKTRVMCVCV